MRIGIIVGSVREERICPAIAQWVMAQTMTRDAEYELIDIKDFDLSLHLDAVPASMANRSYRDAQAARWSETIDRCDGYIFISPEYNHGVPGALKNAFDTLFPEWWSKAIGFIAYGAALGFRVVEQWRLVVATANMFDVKAQVGFSTIRHFENGVFTPEPRNESELRTLLDSLEAATAAMNTMRRR